MNTAQLGQRYNDVGYLLVTLKRDPILCFLDLGKLIAVEKNALQVLPDNLKIDQSHYIKLLEEFHRLLAETQLIKKAENMLKNLK